MINRRIDKLRWILSTQFGMDPVLTLRGLCRLPRYLRDLYAFGGGRAVEVKPCLHDRDQASGNAWGEYFWQDLYVAQKIRDACPERHIDVGSRIDGFVAHVAAFRSLEVVDIRPLRSDIPGVSFIQQDMMSDIPRDDLQADSVSCLHALEHFGLGRYGDALDTQGHSRGFGNLARMTAPGGRLYLSVPIGRPRVLFNANRIIDPRQVMGWACEHAMIVEELVLIKDGAPPQVASNVNEAVNREASGEYALGLFVLSKSLGRDLPGTLRVGDT